MAADTTYPSVVQVRQDGNMAVPTGQYIDIESGATLKSGGTTIINGAGVMTPFTADKVPVAWIY